MFGAVLEIVVNFVIMCPLVHLPRDVRKRAYIIRDRLSAGSPWEVDRVSLVEVCVYATQIKCVSDAPLAYARAQEFSKISELQSLLATTRLVDRETGVQGAVRVMFGMMYMSVLKHYPSNKEQARGTGADENYVTGGREPRGGRTTGGAAKVGLMEKDALFAQGVTFAHHSLNTISSDNIPRLVCEKCHTMVGTWGKCPICDGNVRITPMGSEFERLVHILRTAGIDVKMEIEPALSDRSVRSESDVATRRVWSAPARGVDRSQGPLAPAMRVFNARLRQLLYDSLPGSSRRRSIASRACGAGQELPTLFHEKRAGNIERWDGWDINPEQVERARGLCARETERKPHLFPVKVHDAVDCFSAEFRESAPSGCFDVVSCVFALQFALGSRDSAKEVFKNAFKLLKPGGIFYGITVDGHEVAAQWRKQADEVRSL